MEYEILKSDELAHHGIKGQRWGIRRYQNKDGSLTKAGQKRLKKESDALKKEAEVLKRRKSTQAKVDKLAAKRKAIEEEKKALDEKNKKPITDKPVNAKKSISEMSDDELRKAIERARMEDTYKQLRPDPAPVEKHPLMKKMVNDVLVPAAMESGKKAVQSLIDAGIKKALGDKVDPNSLEGLTKVRDKLKVQKEIKEYKDAIAGKKEEKIDWDAKKKQQEYERNEIRNKREDEAYAEKQAEKQAKKDAEAKAKKDAADAAEAKARAEKESYAKAQERVKEAYDEYVRNGNQKSSNYSQKGGERDYVNPNQERGLTIYSTNSSSSSISAAKTVANNAGSTSVSSLSTNVISRGKKNVESYFTLMGSDGDVLRRYGPDDDVFYRR